MSIQRIRILLRISGLMLWILAIAGFYFVWRSSQELKGDRSEAQTPSEAAPQWQPYEIGDFELIERSGRTITRAELLGRPWIVSFVFTRCGGPCPKITAKMAELQGWLKELDVRQVTITVDPGHDTPQVLRRYADRYGADPDRWLFLTGEAQTVYDLIRNDFKLLAAPNTGEARKPGEEVAHSTSILHVDAAGRVVGKYDGADDVEIARLRRTLEREQAGSEKGQTQARNDLKPRRHGDTEF